MKVGAMKFSLVQYYRENLFAENESTDKKSVLKLLKVTLGLEHNRSLSLSPAKNARTSNGLISTEANCNIEF